MKTRSKVSGSGSKARRPNAAKLQHRSVPKQATSHTASDADPHEEIQRLARELKEALKRETATSDVLEVISQSSGDLEPVFASMLENAVRICDAAFANIYVVEGDGFRLIATYNTPPAFAESRRRSPLFIPGPKNPVRCMMTTRKVVQVPDVAASEPYAEGEPVVVASVELGGVRTFVAVPMLKDNELIGAFLLARQKVRPFTEKQIELVKNFAAQAVIAIEYARLLNELRQRTDDLTETLEQQTATSEVLRIISASPGALETVFQAMLKNATRICEAAFGSMLLRDGAAYRRVALHNAPDKFSEFSDNTPTLKRGTVRTVDRVMDTKQLVHVLDMAAEEPNVPITKFGGARTL
jgi:transcriptional regulator with GAF, ATPase, and Fis domain